MSGREELRMAADTLNGAALDLERLEATVNPTAAEVRRCLHWARRLIGEAKDAVTALEDRPWYGWLWDAVARTVRRGE